MKSEADRFNEKTAEERSSIKKRERAETHTPRKETRKPLSEGSIFYIPASQMPVSNMIYMFIILHFQCWRRNLDT